ncbi:MAG TPA: fatty acyl-CoA synthetase [Acidimicrobiales bacterium]|nr:fatty acyl-CoA synthetase [Acidimicrobiales bacterium]
MPPTPGVAPVLVDDRSPVRRHALGDVLTRTAARAPDRTAIVWQGRRETYGEYNAVVNRVAHAVAERGVRQGTRVAVLSHNCREFLIAYFALAKLGAISVPINFMLGAEEVAFILRHSGAEGMIVEAELGAVATEALHQAGRAELPGLRGWIGPAAAPSGWDAFGDWESNGDDGEPGVAVGDDDPVQLMYTSGTEARPKGVVLSSRSLLWQYAACIIDGEMAPDDVEVHALPFYHCAALHVFFSPNVYLGAANVVLPRPDPGMILRTIESERANRLFCPPTVWISLLRQPDLERYDLSSLTKGYYGAAPMPVEILHELAKRLPQVRLWNFYGQTEMAPLATVLRPHEQLPRAGSAGIACLNVETRVVDEEDRTLPRGEVGEIVHRSPHATLGYWNDEEKTAELFRNGWLHTGDLGVMDADGYLTIVDRKKDMIKTGGENVSSREVEEVIFQHPDVAEVAVFGVPHEHWIEAVTAAVVLRPGAVATPAELIAHARGKLAGYKVPKLVVIVHDLPRNPSGKILKRTLREQFAKDGSRS